MHEIKLGKFRIVRRLGRGGMGAVYEGHDPGLDRRVAIKTLTTEAIADQESRNRFEREARAAAKLQHPNIVTIYELGNFGGKEKPYIVMEYLGGADLAALIDEEEGLPFAEALDIAIQLLKALDFAHQCGVVHRDVKPSNVRYLDDGRVKIMDFGIARVEGSAQITRSGATVGTPYYMSPEQIRAEKIDRRSDIFSAGCILYEMLAGRRPFPGDLPSVFYKIVNEKPPPLVEQRAELPQEVQDILDRALAKEPGQRFQSAGEMAQELEKLLDVYRKSFPRPTGALRNRIEELERLSREDRWRDVIPLAEALVAERPELEPPRRVLRRALGEVRREEEERRVTAEERTRHLAVISQEIAMLYGPPAGVVSAPSRELKLRPETAASSPLGLGSLSVKLGIALMAVIVVAWILFPAVRDALGPKEMAQTVFISSSPSGAA
ncbi:MAG: serine/threonine-protein kinase, partial [Acidobacteriota bacterium]